MAETSRAGVSAHVLPYDVRSDGSVQHGLPCLVQEEDDLGQASSQHTVLAEHSAGSGWLLDTRPLTSFVKDLEHFVLRTQF